MNPLVLLRTLRQRPIPYGLLLAAVLVNPGSFLLQDRAMASPPSPPTSQPLAAYNPSAYTPAVLQLSFNKSKTQGKDFLDLTLIPAEGELVGRRIEVNTEEFRRTLRDFYGLLARQEPLRYQDPKSPARLLYQLLIAPIEPELRRRGVTTLLLAPDAGLQAVPYAALHDGTTSFGERYAFSLTPVLGLLPRDLPDPQATTAATTQQLVLGASRFDGLAPLPLVPQEVGQIARLAPSESYVDRAFTPEVLVNRAGDPAIRRVHVATHAEFQPGGPSRSRIFAGQGALDLSRFASLRQRRDGVPLELFVLSACRTALGDPDSELGFAGLALQAGARSAIGTLWYVDDLATSVFFVQFYRYLETGMPKAEALQATRRALANGQIRLQGDRILGPDGATLLDQLTPVQQRRVEAGLQHPFFWAGIALIGTPW